MNYRQSLGLCPGSGAKSARFSLDSGIRPYSQRLNISVGTSTTTAMNGLRKIDSSSIPQV